jgi:tetratricopeptide (TPR) repeat protein
VVQRISAQIEPQIGARERQLVLRRKSVAPRAWDSYHFGVGSFYRFTSDANAEALAHFETCIALDPSFAEAHAWWAFATIISMVYYDVDPTGAQLDEALAAAQRAIELDDMSAFCHFALARVHLARRDYDRAFWSLETAIDLNPNMATAYCAMGDSLAYQGRLSDAVEQFAKAIHLSPRDPMRWAYSGYCALAYLFKRDFEAAIRWSDDATRFTHCLYWPYAHKAAALGHLGRIEEASRAVAELVTRRVDFSRAFAQRKLFFLERDEQVALYLAGLEKAGVPGT